MAKEFYSKSSILRGLSQPGQSTTQIIRTKDSSLSNKSSAMTVANASQLRTRSTKNSLIGRLHVCPACKRKRFAFADGIFWCCKKVWRQGKGVWVDVRHGDFFNLLSTPPGYRRSYPEIYELLWPNPDLMPNLHKQCIGVKVWKLNTCIWPLDLWIKIEKSHLELLLSCPV